MAFSRTSPLNYREFRFPRSPMKPKGATIAAPPHLTLVRARVLAPYFWLASSRIFFRVLLLVLMALQLRRCFVGSEASEDLLSLSRIRLDRDHMVVETVVENWPVVIYRAAFLT